MIKGIALSLVTVMVTAGCGVNVRAPTFTSPSPSRSTSTSTTTSTSTSTSTSDGEYDPDRDIEPYPTAPADPWAAVDGDQPRRISEDEAHDLKVRNRDHECTAARDHCLLRLTWFIENDGEKSRSPVRRTAVPGVFGPEGPGEPWNVRAQHPPANGGYTAYRTVPATRKLLAKGALAVALDFPTASPGSGGAAYEFMWNIGIVDRVDWDGGKLYLAGRTEPFLISAARVAVLSWAPGGKVTVMGKRNRDQLAVAAADVILPMADRGSVSDPWAAVGKDKQPRTYDDVDAILVDSTVDCDAAHDHCLRPWVWFVEAGGRAVPSRWAGKRFEHAVRPDVKVEDAGMAYRTIPVDPSKLTAGATVVVYNNGSFISHERDAMTNPWRLSKVKSFQSDAGLITLTDGDTVGTALVRVAVLQWFPGEVVEAVP